MTTCVALDPEGFIYATTTPVAECESYILISPTEYHMATQVFEVSPSDISYVFSWGFGAVVLFGLGTPYAVKIARRLIALI